ncbi:MAG TPA: protein kinase [Holophagaceae bacterium]|jgi:tRNA A-37 threonylcarbamoyl transferase component Bud32|nr:protein kinase [Holophagaceae bacterium]
MLSDEKIPQSIGRYQVLKVLGAGAMGSVLLAEDPRIKRKVAIKVVRLESLRSHKDEEEYLARFQREAEVSGLLNHPGIVTVFDVGEEEGIGPFMAMEFVGGQTLEALVKGGIPIPLEQKLRLAAAIAEALDHAHHLGVIHRDVKPGNVMLTEDGRPKLMDFGIAKREDAGLTQTGTFLGTPSYAAPEQIKEGSVTPHSDQFSFAVMVFELLSGKLPFPGSSINTILYRIVNEPPSDPRPPVEGILPEEWHRIFLRALAKEPQDRYPSCMHFIQELAEAALGASNTVVRQDLLATVPPMDAVRAIPPVVAVQPGVEARLSPSALAPDLQTRITPIVQVGEDYDETLSGTLREPKPGSGAWAWVALVLVAAGAGGFLLWNRRAGATVLLKTTPDKAAVSLNGRALADATPVQEQLKAGDHLRFEAKGFQPKELDFTDAAAWPSAIALDPAIGPVELKTEPAGAQVVMDGKAVEGVTPLTVSWNQGQPHQITFTKDAATLPKDFAVGEVPNAAFTLQPASASAAGETGNGSLKLAGGFAVRMKVDGADKGELAPGRSLALPPGSHRVEMSNARVFFSESRAVTVEIGKEAKLQLPGLATLTVSTHPGVGDVLVDGRSAGIQSDGSSLRVAAGRHMVAIRSLSGKTASQAVEVQGDKAVDLPL